MLNLTTSRFFVGPRRSASRTEAIFVEAIRRASTCSTHRRRPCKSTFLKVPCTCHRTIFSSSCAHPSSLPDSLNSVSRNRTIISATARSTIQDDLDLDFVPHQDTANDGFSRATSRSQPRIKLNLPAHTHPKQSANSVDPSPPDTVTLHEDAVPRGHANLMMRLSRSPRPWQMNRQNPPESPHHVSKRLADFPIYNMSADEVWQHYKTLEVPRCSAISRTALRFVLDTLAHCRPRTKQGMDRYMEVINEMVSLPVPIVPLVSEWTAAISFAGRAHKHPTRAQLKKCVDLYNEMQDRFGVKPNRVTFNVILDVAVKARQWDQVQGFLREMEFRGISYDRYTYTTMIQGAGYRGSSDEVSRIVQQMIDKGVQLDTYMINCVMSAYIRSASPQEAEMLFEGMKRGTLHGSFGPSSTHTSEGSSDAHTATQMAIKNREVVQPRNASRSAPDIATYCLLIQHHCKATGDLSRVISLLEDMEVNKVGDSVSLFQSLFSGFVAHGRTKPVWDLDRLSYVYQTLLRTPNIVITQDLARLVIRAFGILGTEDTVMAVSEELDKAFRARSGAWERNKSSNVMRELEIARRYSRKQQVTRPT